jgi:hypothetical protein
MLNLFLMLDLQSQSRVRAVDTRKRRLMNTNALLLTVRASSLLSQPMNPATWIFHQVGISRAVIPVFFRG